MLRTLCLVFIGVLVCTGGILAAEFEFSAGPAFMLNFGETKYRLDSYPVGSELIFPLDFIHTGVAAEMYTLKDGHKDIACELRASLGISDPGNPFTDRDWVVYNFSEYDFSYTESEVTQDYIGLEFWASKRILVDRKLSIAALVGVTYQKASQEAQGFEGWALGYRPGDTTELVRIETSYEGRALTYEVSYLGFNLGLAPRFNFTENVSLDLKAAVSPFLQVKDTDDHLLRFFVTESDGTGKGFFGRASLQFPLPFRGNLDARARLTAEFESLKADLDAVSTWYQDVPEEGRVEGETVVTPHEISATRSAVGLQVIFGL